MAHDAASGRSTSTIRPELFGWSNFSSNESCGEPLRCSWREVGFSRQKYDFTEVHHRSNDKPLFPGCLVASVSVSHVTIRDSAMAARRKHCYKNDMWDRVSFVKRQKSDENLLETMTIVAFSTCSCVIFFYSLPYFHPFLFSFLFVLFFFGGDFPRGFFLETSFPRIMYKLTNGGT